MNAEGTSRRKPPVVASSIVLALACGLLFYSSRPPAAPTEEVAPAAGPSQAGATHGKSSSAKTAKAKPDKTLPTGSAQPTGSVDAHSAEAAPTRYDVFNRATAGVVAVYDDLADRDLNHGVGFIAVETLAAGNLSLPHSLRLSATRKLRDMQNLSHHVCGVVVNGRLQSSNLTCEFADARQSVVAIVRSIDEKRNLSFLEVHYLADAAYPALGWPEASPNPGDSILGIAVYQRATRIMSPGVLNAGFTSDGVNYWDTTCRVPPGIESGVLVDGATRVLGFLKTVEGPANYPGPALRYEELKAFVDEATKAGNHG